MLTPDAAGRLRTGLPPGRCQLAPLAPGWLLLTAPAGPAGSIGSIGSTGPSGPAGRSDDPGRLRTAAAPQVLAPVDGRGRLRLPRGARAHLGVTHPGPVLLLADDLGRRYLAGPAGLAALGPAAETSA